MSRYDASSALKVVSRLAKVTRGPKSRKTSQILTDNVIGRPTFWKLKPNDIESLDLWMPLFPCGQKLFFSNNLPYRANYKTWKFSVLTK